MQNRSLQLPILQQLSQFNSTTYLHMRTLYIFPSHAKLRDGCFRMLCLEQKKNVSKQRGQTAQTQLGNEVQGFFEYMRKLS